MDETLSYASRGSVKRWSGLSLAAFGIGLLSLPAFVVIAGSTVGSGTSIEFLIGVMFVMWACEISVGAVSITHALAGRKRLRGLWLALLGLLTSLGWPVVPILWAFSHWPNC